MNSPFESSAFDKAVSPMFDELVAVTAVRDGASRRQCLKVAVFDDADVEPIDENGLETGVEVIRCVASGNDWRFVRDCLVRGDRVRRQDGREYQVTKIGRDDAIGWAFNARRVK